jgi:ribosomal protein L11 methyltransferase
MNWIEVSLIADGEMAEAVAEVLARYDPGRVVIASTTIENDPEGAGRVIGPLRITAYIPDDENLESNRKKIEEGLYYLGRVHKPLPAPTFTPLKETNWIESWKEQYHPIPIGQKLLILPSWYENPDPSRIPIIIEPGMAFGTGTHPTTQVCLELLEGVFDKRRKINEQKTPSAAIHSPSVIDIGCGSGILTIAARKLGASSLLGVDIDPEALVNALENAKHNGVEDQIEWAVGSVREIQGAQFALESADILLANLLAPIIIRLLDQGLAGLLNENGSMILSGILTEQEDDVHAALKQHRLGIRNRRQVGDWVGLLGYRSD